MPEWDVQRLDRHHACQDFDCGKTPLTDWLKQRARSFIERDLARVYVAVRPGETRVFGYYALSTCQTDSSPLPDQAKKKLPPRLILPAVLLGKLAVDRSTRGQNLGRRLLVDALRRVQHAADEIGIRLVMVDAIDDEAREFYLHFGFDSFIVNRNTLFMTVSVIRQFGLDPLSG